MVFLIQNSQNRDSKALQLKLDELIHAVSGARDSLLDLEELSQEELEEIRTRYILMAASARKAGARSEVQESTPNVAPAR